MFFTGTAVAQFSLSTVNVSAESVNGSVRVTWNTTVPPQCVTSVSAVFRTSHGSVVANYTTTNMSQTEIIQSGLWCGEYYYITVVIAGKTSGSLRATVNSRPKQAFVSGGKVCYCEMCVGIQ